LQLLVFIPFCNTSWFVFGSSLTRRFFGIEQYHDFGGGAYDSWAAPEWPILWSAPFFQVLTRTVTLL
jgi:hypothetical protein